MKPRNELARFLSDVGMARQVREKDTSPGGGGSMAASDSSTDLSALHARPYNSMTITTLLTLVLTATPVQPTIVAASVFKNGFAVVTREIDVPGAGEYSVSEIPQSSLGTLWFSATSGSTIDS